jgi:hypothetical protein
VSVAENVAGSEVAPLEQASTLPALRLLPAPVGAPPYDDESTAGRPLQVVGTAPAALPVVPLPAPAPLRLVPSPAPEPSAPPAAPACAPADPHPDAEDDGPRRTPLAQLPPARPFAHALVQRLIEVLAGLRPVGQLQRDTTLELFDELEAAVRAARCPQGPRPTRRDVRSLHVQERADGVAEVCATVRRGGRLTALAFRLEGRSGAWRCTALSGL